MGISAHEYNDSEGEGIVQGKGKLEQTYEEERPKLARFHRIFESRRNGTHLNRLLVKT